MRTKTILLTFCLTVVLVCVVSIRASLAADIAKVHRTGIGSPNAFIFVAGVDKGFYRTTDSIR